MTRALAIGAAVFLLALFRSLADGIGLADESWFLQVISRVRSGDVLYRDVFFGTTPLSLYATAGLTYVVGLEILAVKIVTNACFAISTVLAAALARAWGLSRLAVWAIVAAMFIWGRPYANPPYTPMAVAGFLAAILAGVRAPATDARAWGLAGLLAGLSFCAKPNVGLLALAAVGVACLLSGDSRARARTLLFVAAGFGVTLALVLTPVLMSGGGPGLWEYGFAAKGAYVRAGGVSFLQSVGDWLHAFGLGPSPVAMERLLHGAVVLLPIAVLVAAIGAARRLDRRGWTLVAFAGAATLIAFPRWDRFHMAYAVPVHLVALTYLAQHTFLRLHRVVGLGIVGVAIAVAVKPITNIVSGHRRPASFAHFRGPLLGPDVETTYRMTAERLQVEAGGRSMFILGMDAGFWYLTSGVRNPTPFDIPASTSVGSSGVPWLVERLSDGRIEQVCLDHRPPDRMTLTPVAAFVREHFQSGLDLGPCTIYRSRLVASGDPGSRP